MTELYRFLSKMWSFYYSLVVSVAKSDRAVWLVSKYWSPPVQVHMIYPFGWGASLENHIKLLDFILWRGRNAVFMRLAVKPWDRHAIILAVRLLATGGIGSRKGKGPTKWEGPPGDNSHIAIPKLNFITKPRKFFCLTFGVHVKVMTLMSVTHISYISSLIYS